MLLQMTPTQANSLHADTSNYSCAFIIVIVIVVAVVAVLYSHMPVGPHYCIANEQ